MIQERNARYTGSEGRESLYDISVPNGAEWLVVFIHGYKGFKDWGAWDLVMQAFVEQGIGFCKSNLSHNGGTVDQPIDFPDLEAFGHNSYWKEYQDTGYILDQLEDTYPQLLGMKVALIGHSRGGGDVILRAAHDGRVRKLITWAGISDIFSRMPQGDRLKGYAQAGVDYVMNARTGQTMPVYYDPFYTETEAHREQLDIPTAARQVQVPWLIVHGEQDESVLPSEAEKLKELQPNARVEKVKGAGHTFGSSHPWQKDGLPEHLRKVVDLSIDFIKA